MCRTLKAQYCKVSGANFIRQNTMGATAILEIEMEEPKPIQVAQIYDREQNPMNGRVYSEDGIAPTLRTPTGGLSEPKIMQICSYVPNSMCAGKIVDADGIATAVMENHGMPTAVVEPLSCAIRGRNPDCPSDRTAGINTEQRLEIGSDVANCVTTVQKDSMVIEPAILTPIRTEKAKELRRQGIETFANRELVPRTDGCSGTITTVVHDNLVYEPRKEPVRIGVKYGKLTVLEKLDKKQGANYRYKCQCDCGAICEVDGGHLGVSTMSCGCLKGDSHRTHGESQSRLYNIWTLMKRRCNNPNTPNYDKYGGRCIKVCNEWMQYEPFRDWAIQGGYADNLTIDRIDNNGDYEPSNCRWATHSQQVNNRNPYGIINYDGITVDSKGLRCQIMVNGRKEYIAHSLNDVAILIEKRNIYIQERGLPHKIQEYKHDYDFLLNYHSVLDWISETQKDNLLREPCQVIGSMQANAMRGSIDGVSPCLTEAMGMGGGQIPMIVQNAHGYNKGGVFEDVAPTVTSSAYQDNNHVVESSILGYTRDDKGGIQNYHERELAGTIHTYSGSGGNTDQFVKEPISRKDNIAFKEMPDGNIHAFRANDPKKSTAPEWQITNADNVHPTITTSHEPKVLLKYRIRKLTERECFRLMGVDDADIDKIDAYRIKTTLKNGTVKEKPIPKSQKYKMAGNSICISPLYYLFKAMFIDDKPLHQARQLSLFD